MPVPVRFAAGGFLLESRDTCRSVSGMITPGPAVSYLDLPPPDRYPGDPRRGEIELTGADGGSPAEAPVVFANRYVTILNDSVRFPTGQTGSYMRIFHSSELVGRHGVVIVPTRGDQLYLIRLFRHPTRSWHWEFPRGFAEPGATPEEDAARELSEELGATAAAVTDLGTVAPNTGVLATRAHVFHMELELEPSAHALLPSQAAEAISGIVAISRSGFLAQLRSGDHPVLREINCGFTLSAMMLALARGILA